MNPANRSNSSQVTYIGITSPLGKAKKKSAFPIKGSNRTVMVTPKGFRHGYFNTRIEFCQYQFSERKRYGIHH